MVNVVRHTAPIPQPETPPARANIQAESERRIYEGFMLPDGSRFRCDTDSMTRLNGFCSAFDDAEALGQSSPVVTFRTAAGIEVTLTAKAQAIALRMAAANHIAAVLTASAALQALDPIPEDYATNEAYWP